MTVLALGSLPTLCHAQAYPEKPIRLVSPFPPGGGTDLMGRLIGAHIHKQWGQPVVVENRPGANGTIGSEYVAKSPPDGYTLLVGTMGTHSINASLYRKVQAMLGSPAAAANFVKAGKVRALAVTSIKRSVLMPDIPTMDEQGVKNYDVTTWYGLWTPAQTPRPIVTRWHGEVVRMLALAATVQQLHSQGLEPVGNTPEEFTAQIRSELQKWARVAKSAGIQPE